MTNDPREKPPTDAAEQQAPASSDPGVGEAASESARAALETEADVAGGAAGAGGGIIDDLASSTIEADAEAAGALTEGLGALLGKR